MIPETESHDSRRPSPFDPPTCRACSDTNRLTLTLGYGPAVLVACPLCMNEPQRVTFERAGVRVTVARIPAPAAKRAPISSPEFADTLKRIFGDNAVVQEVTDGDE